MRRFLLIVLLVGSSSATALAESQTGKVDATTARLGTLSLEERRLLAPHLAKGR